MAASALAAADWYWMDAERNEVAELLTNEPDGSFSVRNASTQGDYTLTVKYDYSFSFMLHNSITVSTLR